MKMAEFTNTTPRGVQKLLLPRDYEMKKTNIMTNVEAWNPELAKEALSKGGANRRVNSSKVSIYAAMMKDGKWEMNGETVKLSRTGKIIDGQHRLHAIVKSGKTVKILTVRNLAPKTQATVDNGFKRTTAHVLEIQGEKNATNLAFALSLICRSDSGQLHTVRHRGEHKRPRRDECVAKLKSNPDIRHYVNHKFTTHFKQIASSGLFAFCWYTCAKKHPDLADMFYEQLAMGVAMGTEDPVWHLRERLLRSRHTEDPRYKLDTLQKLQLVAYAWNAAVAGKSMKKMKMVFDNDAPVFN